MGYYSNMEIIGVKIKPKFIKKIRQEIKEFNEKIQVEGETKTFRHYFFYDF